MAIALALGGVAFGPAHAQTYTAGADLYFYGDNTEFTNPFRAGETTLGASGRVFVDARLNEAVTVRAGLFGLGRFGAHRFLEHAEPAIALLVSRGASRFVFGSLDTVAAHPEVRGPDHETPHGLLPPLQAETLAFTRGQEMGLQWLLAARRVEHDAWINWQRLNAAAHRERFDAGYRARARLAASLHLQGQWHIVHEGGQQHATGPVLDSQAGALGVEWATPLKGGTLSAESFGVAARFVPDRARPALSEDGLATFSRLAWQGRRWRAHALVWRGRDMLKDEGDANYLARRRDGTRVRGVRDYAEAGVTRHFRPAPGVHILAAFRLHRIESDYEYSYRLAARVRVRRPF